MLFTLVRVNKYISWQGPSSFEVVYVLNGMYSFMFFQAKILCHKNLKSKFQQQTKLSMSCRTTIAVYCDNHTRYNHVDKFPKAKANFTYMESLYNLSGYEAAKILVMETYLRK
jgi:hypothetical protein